MDKQENKERTHDNISDAEMIEALDQLNQYRYKERERFLSIFKSILSRIDYPSSRLKEYLRGGDNYHIGYCHVYEETEYHSTSYPNHKFYSVVESDNIGIHIPHLLMRQEDNTEDTFHCLVWQTCQCEDCYSGYILFPLVGGEYWAIRFED